MSSTFNLSIYAGETRTLVVTVTDQDGVAIDLTGAAITYTLNLPTPVTKTVGAGITITGALTGEFEIVLTEADTQDVDHSVGVEHECKILTSSGEVLVTFRGRAGISASLIPDMTP